MSDVSREQECWRAVPGYQGFYEVSDAGRIRSLERRVRGPRGSTQRCPGVFLSDKPDHYGYHYVDLSRDRRRRRVGVHILVLEAFVGPCPPGMECLHGNGNSMDNRLCNLSWGTHGENNLDQVRHGTHPWAKRDRCNWGHLFEGANLVELSGKRRRDCRACRIARTHAARALKANLPFDFQADADAMYLRYMANGTARKTHCRRGHPLVAPNLVSERLKKYGKRICWSCNRAQQKCRSTSAAAFKETADQYYSQLEMGSPNA